MNTVQGWKAKLKAKKWGKVLFSNVYWRIPQYIPTNLQPTFDNSQHFAKDTTHTHP